MNHLMGHGETVESLTRTRLLLTGAVLISIFVASVVAAQARAASPPADFSLDFTSTTPSAPADAALHILYRDPENPDDPGAKPPALTEVRIKAPAGTVFDPSAVPACTASDGELQMQGRSACPAETVVGTGFGAVESSMGPPSDPFVLDATMINAGDAIIELFTFQGSDTTAAVDRARFESPNTMVLHPAVVPGITEREFAWTYLTAPPAASGAFVTTPPRCPSSGEWTSTLEYSVTTGASYSVSDTTPCKRPRIDVELAPTEVAAGERERIRVRLSSSDPDCISGAAVRLQGHGSERSNGQGAATVVASLNRPGDHRVTASKPGCARGRAALSVSPGA